jgi:dienelactone hydrolase
MYKIIILRAVCAVMSVFISQSAAWGALKTEAIKYKQENTQLIGYLAYDDAVTGTRPAILVVHEWWGLNDYVRKRTEQLASLGYIAFAADIYGKGCTVKNPEHARALSGKFMGNDRKLLRERVNAGLQVLKDHPLVDKKRIAAIGYCFGGTTVLELARSGADIAGVVSFHGGLSTPRPAEAQALKAKILVLHGADDPNVPMPQVTAFQDEMRRVKADWQMIFYGGAVHAFTNPDSGSDPSRGVAYNEKADRRSWEHMNIFFDELFR